MAITPQDRKGKSQKAKLQTGGATTVTSAKNWKKANTVDILTLPSGNNCRVKRPGLPQLLSDNVLPDVLTPIAQNAVEAGQNGVPFDEKTQMAKIGEAISDPQGMTALFDSIDRLTAHCVVEPPVLYHRRIKAAGQADQIQQSYVPEWEDIPEEDRDPDILYTDEVDDNDKFFIFQFVVGGTRDLERFRQELSSGMASMESVAGSQVQTQ